MSHVKINILANYFGRGWLAVVSLASVPLYVHFMGIESYGLVGFFATLQAALSILEIGLYTTVNRELARLSNLDGKQATARDLVRTLEIIYWLMAGAVTLCILLLAPIISAYWLNVEQLSTRTVKRAITIMAIAIGFEAPYPLYHSGLMGLQRQVTVNFIVAGSATFRCIGALAVLWLISPTIEAYALWQILAAIMKTFTGFYFLWRFLPRVDRKARFDKTHLLSLWRFSLGVSGSAALTLLLIQGDKIVLSRLLTLEYFGYYNLGWVLAFSLIGLLVDPIRDASFPRLSQLIQIGDPGALADLYHRSCQAVSAILLPISVVTALFSYEILWIWTGSSVTAENTSPIMAVLVIGMALRGVTTIPEITQLAWGWTGLLISMNATAVAVFIPLVGGLSSIGGASGAAWAWVFVYSGYIFIGMPMMHARILKGELRDWFLVDLGLPGLVAIASALLFRWAAPVGLPKIWTCFVVVCAMSLPLAITALAAPSVRAWLSGFWVENVFTAVRTVRAETSSNTPRQHPIKTESASSDRN